jgi:hypothetical protein
MIDQLDKAPRSSSDGRSLSIESEAGQRLFESRHAQVGHDCSRARFMPDMTATAVGG